MASLNGKIFSTLDLYLAAFLSINGVVPSFKVHEGRVIFVFEASDVLHKLILNYNSNMLVPVADFVTTVRTLKGQMLTLRGGRK